jgi:outer membrane protein assembly factor BamD (BamD/ComL family)
VRHASEVQPLKRNKDNGTCARHTNENLADADKLLSKYPMSDAAPLAKKRLTAIESLKTKN